ncbi:hypothetical protein V500_04182 [Pseudogymnoascus sp. VKM F-4518 (FW-2643)]|nr:hypothetical protein V500_04182 [Pseudogymnoascus sp. VKM F-4518 (FW-2643)]
MDEFRELFLRHGPGHVVASFIQREQRRLDLGSLLEETFRRIDLGPRDLVCRQGAYVSPEVEFLLRHGAFFHPEREDILLEDTYRHIELGPLEFKRRAGACLSPEVEFLLIQGASFQDVPCGLSQLVENTKAYLRQSGQNQGNFFLQQAVQNNIHNGWRSLLGKVYNSHLESVDSEILCHIVRLTSTHQDEIKIYTTQTQVRKDGILWPPVALRRKDDSLINASIVELRGRSSGVDEVTIRVQGKEIKALRPLLQARSSYFKKFIDDNPKKTSFDIDELYKPLFDTGGLYKTIRFVLLYAQSEPRDVTLWSGFRHCGSRQTTERTLDELVDILYAASAFEMADLLGAVAQHIVKHGVSFIYSKNAQEIKDIAKEVNASILERYCDTFIATNLRTFTLFPSLPVELRMNIWRQMASQPQLVLAPSLDGNSGIRKLGTPSHIARILKVCRESNAEIQQFWGRPSLDGINFKFDIIWLHSRYVPQSMDIESSLKGARYCATPAPDPSLDSEWELGVDKIIKCCPHVEVLYLATTIVSHNDEIEYCRKFINREPRTIVEARRWIEESAHQRIRELRRDLQLELPKELREELPDCSTLPRIMLIDEKEIMRYIRVDFAVR